MVYWMNGYKQASWSTSKPAERMAVEADWQYMHKVANGLPKGEIQHDFSLQLANDKAVATMYIIFQFHGCICGGNS